MMNLPKQSMGDENNEKRINEKKEGEREQGR